MKVFLMYRDRDFDREHALLTHAATLIQDLELETLFAAMARGDRFLYDIVRTAVLAGDSDLSTILYRQAIVKDSLQHAAVIREIYAITVESDRKKHDRWLGIFGRHPSGILSGSVNLLEMYVELLGRLKQIADEYAGQFQSEGFSRFFSMIQQELDDEYFASIQTHLKALRFRSGVLMSARLGQGNEGTGYVLRKPNDPDGHWLKRILPTGGPVYTFSIHPRDEHGGRALADLKDRGLNLVANAVAQSADHVDSFFKMLRIELAFYVGCLNLHEQLAQWGSPTCFPVPLTAQERRHTFTGLYDVCLALVKQEKVVGNDADADRRNLVIITGANQGGKSTFLRSIGLAQLMMECGMYVPAESFSANLCQGLYTHYKRQEDATMKSGKLDEELSRMSEIADGLRPDAMVLFNESFVATNEREGSEIASQITRALLERHIKVFFVTHQYEFAHRFHDGYRERTLFLRAERQTDGSRTFKLRPGEPLQTSYGPDLYQTIFKSNGEE